MFSSSFLNKRADCRSFLFSFSRFYPNSSTIKCQQSQFLPTIDEREVSLIFLKMFLLWRLWCGWVENFVHAAKVDQAKFDVMQLHARPELAAQHRMVDDASGDVTVRGGKCRTIVWRQNTHIE